MSTTIETTSVASEPAATPAISPVTLLSGLAGAIGCDFRSAQNQLVFTEYGTGKLSALNLFGPSTIVSTGSTLLRGTYTFDLDTGTMGGVSASADIWWEQQTAALRRMVPQNSAQILNLGVVNYGAIAANGLELLPYSTAPIPGNNDITNRLIAGDVFAVRTTAGNFAKVRVVTYGYDLTIEWTTYHITPGYVVLGTGYTNPEDVKVSGDGTHAFVSERAGNVVKVALASANRASASLVVSGMTAPQQMALDEAHNAAYVVEYAASGRLWRIDVTSGAKVAVISGLTNAVGLALSADRQYAYVSEQTTSVEGGRISRYRLSDGTRTSVKTGLTSPFFLTWADAANTALFVAERDPANRITRVDIGSGSSSSVASTAVRPSSVALVGSTRLLACCDSVIQSIDLVPFQPTGPLLIGIGFIPYTDIKPSGLADTSGDPGAHYPVKDVPFGGTLPLLVNHQRAANDGAAFYRVKIDGVVRTDEWTDDRWNGFTFVTQTMTPQVVGGQPGYYPVRPVSDLLLWLHPSLGTLTDSTNLSNALHTIQVEFVDSLGHPVESSLAATIRVDNNRCVATVSTPTLNGSSADPNCGLLHYTGATALPVTMPIVATHPTGFATYSLQVIKGVNPIIGVSGPVPAASPVTSPAATLLGTCTIAAFAEYLYVAATANNGWSRQSQYDASAAVAFVLAP